jgi:hypothetical protein
MSVSSFYSSRSFFSNHGKIDRNFLLEDILSPEDHIPEFFKVLFIE